MSPCYQWRPRIDIFSTHLWASIICSGATSYKTLFLLPGVSLIVHLNERTVGRKNQNSSTMFVWRKYLSFYVNIFMCSLPIDDTIHLLLFPFFQFGDCHMNTIPVTFGVQTSTHNEERYRELSADTNMFRPKSMCHMFYWLEKNICLSSSRCSYLIE